MKKLIPVTLALGALTAFGTGPVSAQPIHQRWHNPRPYYDYAPGYTYAPGPTYRSAPYTPYPYGGLHTGTQENREEWDPGYVGGAPE